MNFMLPELQNLIDLDRLQSFFTDFSTATGLSVGLADARTRKVVHRIGQRELCQRFHCVDSASREVCDVSTLALQAGLGPGVKMHIGHCEKGLVLGCTPITVSGKHIANLLIGAVFYAPPDPDRIKLQAQTYGYDEQTYLNHVEQVPVVGEEKFTAMLRFLANMLDVVIRSGVAERERCRAIAEKESLLRSILSVAPVGIGMTVNRKLQWVNPRMADMTGYGCAELTGQSARLLYPDDAEFERVGREKYAMIRKDGSGTVETRMRTQNGSIIDVELSSTPLQQDDLSAGVIFTALDRTEQNRARRRVEESELKYRELFNNISSGMAIYSATADGTDFIIDDLNVPALIFSQVQRGEVLGERVTKIFPGIQALGLLEVLRRVWRSGEAETLLARKYRDDRRRLWVENYVFKLPSGQVAAVFEDVTERKNFEQTIIRSKEEWEKTFDAMTDIVTIQDSHFHIVRANRAAHQLFAAEFGSLNGKKCYAVFRGLDEPCSGCPLLHTLSDTGGHTAVITHDILNKTFQVSSSLLLPPDGKAQQLIHVARDITLQRQLQEEAARSHRLASLGELAAGVAHEINNPNGTVLYNSDMLRTAFSELMPYLERVRPEADGQRFGGLTYGEILKDFPDLLTDSYEAAVRIKRIVTDLRDFSRYDGSEMTEAVDLNQVVTTAIRLSGNTLKQATEHFSLHLAETLPAIQGVGARLGQVVLNLLLNACQALTAPEQTIVVSTGYDAPLRQVWLKVADEGCGIAADMIEQILDPFVTTKRDVGGTGLGLSVSARIVKEHRGILTFVSTPGLGTTVTLKLPVEGDSLHAC